MRYLSLLTLAEAILESEISSNCIFMTILCGAASADVTYIHTTQDTGLHTKAYSWLSPAGIVPAGTKLEMSGENTFADGERWIYVEYNGELYFIPSWVPHTRSVLRLPSVLDAPSQTVSTPAKVDNCCFVDRHCETDQEWTDGYGAYQNNECPVSAPSGQPISQPSIGSAPANVDNCCFVNRHCETDQEWADGYWAYQNNECPVSAPVSAVQPIANARPQVVGSTEFVQGLESTLSLMQQKAPQWYQYVASVTRLIEQDYEPEHCRSAGAYVGSGKTTIGTCMLYGPVRGALYRVSLAGILAHEVCHHHGHDVNPETGEFIHALCTKAARDTAAAIYAYGS